MARAWSPRRRSGPRLPTRRDWSTGKAERCCGGFPGHRQIRAAQWSTLLPARTGQTWSSASVPKAQTESTSSGSSTPVAPRDRSRKAPSGRLSARLRLPRGATREEQVPVEQGAGRQTDGDLDGGRRIRWTEVALDDPGDDQQRREAGEDDDRLAGSED